MGKRFAGTARPKAWGDAEVDEVFFEREVMELHKSPWLDMSTRARFNSRADVYINEQDTVAASLNRLWECARHRHREREAVSTRRRRRVWKIREVEGASCDPKGPNRRKRPMEMMRCEMDNTGMLRLRRRRNAACGVDVQAVVMREGRDV
jgi:hypothetical protein